MTAVIIIVILLIVFLAIGNNKGTETTYVPTVNSRQPSSTALEMSFKYFGREWQTFVLLKSTSFKEPKNFHETIAFALEKLSGNEHKNLMLSFLGVSSNTGSQGNAYSITFSVGLSNYEQLHTATFNLLKEGRFSESGMLNLLKQQQRQTKKQDDSVIDITGKSQLLDNSQFPATDYESHYQQTQALSTAYDPNEYRLGKLYKDKLSLSTQEVSWLNKFWNPANVFLELKAVVLKRQNFIWQL